MVQKKIITILSSFVLLVLFLSLVFIFTHASDNIKEDEITITIAKAPTQAVITINGVTIHKDTVTLKKNINYTIHATAKHFNDYTFSKQFSDIDDSVLVISLTPSDKQGRIIRQDQKNIYSKNQSLFEQSVGNAGKKAKEKNPILNYLPYHIKNGYSIGYTGLDKTFKITIHGGEGYRQPALDKIRSMGFDPGDYTIVFVNYEDPFNDKN